MQISDLVSDAGMALSFWGVFVMVFRRTAGGPNSNPHAIWIIWGVGLQLVSSVMVHDLVSEGVNGALLVFWLQIWWNGGGGDGTRRRLRKLSWLVSPAPLSAGA